MIDLFFEKNQKWQSNGSPIETIKTEREEREEIIITASGKIFQIEKRRSR